VAFIDVVEVDMATPDPRLWGSHIDRPITGMRLEGNELDVAGWALGREVEVTGLEFDVGGRIIERPLNALRPDLADGFPGVADADRAGFLVGLEMPRSGEAEVAVAARLDDGSLADIGSLHLQRRWRASHDPALRRRVSVVIPCHNQAHFLAETIQSVIDQSYDDVEIVVVDDGSDDNTEAIAGLFDGVRCVRQVRGGVSAARNRGIRETLGDFLVFLDADDVLAPDALRVGVQALDEHPEAAFVFGHAAFLMEDGSEPPAPYTPSFPGDFYEHLVSGRTIATPACAMFRRATFTAVGTFDEGRAGAADYEMYCRIARHHPVHPHGSIVVSYRRHGTSMSANHTTMLRETLAVVRTQRRAVLEGEAPLSSYRAGLAYWKRGYGELLTDALQRDILEHRWIRALGRVAALARYWPRGLVVIARSPRRYATAQSPYDPDPPVT
jgi:glycosyltransferase involved in cell wall biosynthesis